MDKHQAAGRAGQGHVQLAGGVRRWFHHHHTVELQAFGPLNIQFGHRVVKDVRLHVVHRARREDDRHPPRWDAPTAF